MGARRLVGAGLARSIAVLGDGRDGAEDGRWRGPSRAAEDEGGMRCVLVWCMQMLRLRMTGRAVEEGREQARIGVPRVPLASSYGDLSRSEDCPESWCMRS